MVVKIVYAANTVFLLLLTVICTNVATLVFARTATRGWEVAVRSALGATRRRIIGQLFTESLVLAALAAMIAIVVAKLSLRWGLSQIGGDAVPFWVNDSLSSTTLLYAGILTMVATVIVGVFPALRVTRLNVQDSLRREQAAPCQPALRRRVDDSDRGAGGDHGGVAAPRAGPGDGGRPVPSARGRDRRRRQLPAGFRDVRAPERNPIRPPCSSGPRRSLAELEGRLRLEPGVEQVAFADRLPVEDTSKYRIEVDTVGGVPATGLRASTLVHVSSGFFAAFGTGRSPAAISRRRTSNVATSSS